MDSLASFWSFIGFALLLIWLGFVGGFLWWGVPYREILKALHHDDYPDEEPLIIEINRRRDIPVEALEALNRIYNDRGDQ